MTRHESSTFQLAVPISADTPDWSREAKASWHWHSSRSLLASLRAYKRVRHASGPDARSGPNCLLMQQVTLGTGGAVPGAPSLAVHVDIGAGAAAKVLGGVMLAEHAVVRANAMVLCDVAAGAPVVGAPARIVRTSSALKHVRMEADS